MCFFVATRAYIVGVGGWVVFYMHKKVDDSRIALLTMVVEARRWVGGACASCLQSHDSRLSLVVISAFVAHISPSC